MTTKSKTPAKRGRGRPQKTESEKMATEALRKEIKRTEETRPLSLLLEEVKEDPFKDPEVILEGWEKELIKEFVANGGRKGDAAKKVGLGSSNTSLSRLLTSAPGRVYLSRCLDLKKEEMDLTQIEVVNKARKLYDQAMSAEDFKAAMLAVDFLGKYLGMQVDRSEHITRTQVFTSDNAKKDITSYQRILSKVVTSKEKADKLIEGASPMLLELTATKSAQEAQRAHQEVDYTEVGNVQAQELHNKVFGEDM